MRQRLVARRTVCWRARWLILSGVLAVFAGCGVGEPEKSESQSQNQGSATSITAETAPKVAIKTYAAPFEHEEQSVMELWAHSCALCHVDGNAGAPRMGNAEEWQPRLAKGPDVLLQHTLEGFNQMPPLGYCMVCERDDFVAMIDLMTEGVSP